MMRWLLFLAFVLLCVLCLMCHGPRLQEGLQGEALAALQGAGVADAEVGLDGCRARLDGTAPTAEALAAAQEAIRSLPWVCGVDDRLTLASSRVESELGPGPVAGRAPETGGGPSAVGTAPRLRLRTEQGRLALAGGVPSAGLRDDLMTAARSSFGEGGVVGQVEVVEGAERTGWPGSFGRLVDELRQGPDGLNVEIQGAGDGIESASARLGGTVVSELARDRLVGAIDSSLPDLSLEDGLTIRQAASDAERLQAAADEALTGRLVEFESGSARLTPAGRRVLDALLPALRSLPGRLEVAGHTDAQGDAAFNLDLSRRRAEAVVDYLVAQGLDRDRFEPRGYGETRPIADNGTPEGRQRNRRTEFLVLGEA